MHLLSKTKNELVREIAALMERNAELEAEHQGIKESLHRQSTYLNSLHETALSLLNRSGLENLLADIVKRTCDLLHTAHGFIHLARPERELPDDCCIYGQKCRRLQGSRQGSLPGDSGRGPAAGSGRTGQLEEVPPRC